MNWRKMHFCRADARPFLRCFAPSLVLVALTVAVRICSGALSDTGRWSPTQNWGNIAIHMLILPGDGNPDHSRILWWSGEQSGQFFGGQWGWSPGGDSCSAFHGSSFTARTVPASGVDVFCAGNAQLMDSLFIPGGTDTVTLSYGEKRARVFKRGSGTTSWS